MPTVDRALVRELKQREDARFAGEHPRSLALLERGRRVMPNGGAEIDDIYRKRALAPSPLIAASLVLLIAPGEELFWRGLVNRYLAQQLGPVAGNAAGATIYGAVHLVSGNLTLTGAAGVAGAFWSLEHLAQGRMAALIVSHVAWDVWIFLVRPTA